MASPNSTQQKVVENSTIFFNKRIDGLIALFPKKLNRLNPNTRVLGTPDTL